MTDWLNCNMWILSTLSVYLICLSRVFTSSADCCDTRLIVAIALHGMQQFRAVFWKSSAGENDDWWKLILINLKWFIISSWHTGGKSLSAINLHIQLHMKLSPGVSHPVFTGFTLHQLFDTHLLVDFPLLRWLCLCLNLFPCCYFSEKNCSFSIQHVV